MKKALKDESITHADIGQNQSQEGLSGVEP